MRLTEIKAVHGSLPQRPHVRAVRIALPKEAPQHYGSAARVRRVDEGDARLTLRSTDAEENLLAARLARLHLPAELRARCQAGGVAVVFGVLFLAAAAEVDDGEAVGGLEAVNVAKDHGGDAVVLAEGFQSGVLGR